jgi:hypothetical protein
VLYDVTDPKWREKAHTWISEAYENQCYLLYAIGTKDDLLVKEGGKSSKGMK